MIWSTVGVIARPGLSPPTASLTLWVDMTWLIAIAAVLGIAALLLFGVLSLIVEILYAPRREPSTTPQIWLLVALGVAALVISVLLDSVASGAMAIPWVLVCGAVGHPAQRPAAPETEGQRREREAAERKQAEQDRKRAAAQRQWPSANALTR